MNKIKRGTTWLHKEIEEDFKNSHLYGNLSYATLCKLCFSDMILCNDIDKIEDYSIWDNMEFDREEDENGDFDYPEIYQYYLVNTNDYFFEKYKDKMWTPESLITNILFKKGVASLVMFFFYNRDYEILRNA